MEHVFVYGTLKADQCRGHQWPLEPLLRREGWTLGELYDLGPYPALQSGSDPVLGEVWSFHSSDLERVLRVLDEIEVTNQPQEPNEYDRVEKEVILGDNKRLIAQAYVFVDRSQLTPQRRIHPWRNWRGQLVAAWPLVGS